MSEQEPITESSPDDETPKTSPAWRRLLTKKRLIVLVVVGILAPALGYAAIAASRSTGETSASPEVSLGAFWYETTATAASEKIRAEFQLHLELLAQIDSAARTRLEARRFKVQQNVEELLRQAHNADFEDPSLTELKRQIQVQINETLGMRGAIAEVIVTDLIVEVQETKTDESETTQQENIYRNLDAEETVTNDKQE